MANGAQSRGNPSDDGRLRELFQRVKLLQRENEELRRMERHFERSEDQRTQDLHIRIMSMEMKKGEHKGIQEVLLI